MSSKLITDVQTFLKSRGFDPGPLDGVEGPLTLKAWSAFKATMPAVVVPAPAPARVVSQYTEDFNAFFEFLKEWEGTTYENDPADPGGETKYGIDKRSHPTVDIRSLTEESAKKIYWQEWNAQGVADFPVPLRQVYFNYCVNTGQSRAVKLVQQALGLKIDGILGPVTKAAIAKCDHVAVAHKTSDFADSFYRSLNKLRFMRGWLNRNHAMRSLVGEKRSEKDSRV
jgi:lysozyme family protein